MSEPTFSRENIDTILFQLIRVGAIDFELSIERTERAQHYLYEKLNSPDKTFDEIMSKEIEQGTIIGG